MITNLVISARIILTVMTNVVQTDNHTPDQPATELYQTRIISEIKSVRFDFDQTTWEKEFATNTLSSVLVATFKLDPATARPPAPRIAIPASPPLPPGFQPQPSAALPIIPPLPTSEDLAREKRNPKRRS